MEKEDDSTLVDENDPPPQASMQVRLVQWCRARKAIAAAVAVMILSLPLLGLLALAKTHAQWTSPGTYPSPEGYGAGNWHDAYGKARAMVSRMSFEEMNNITIGFSGSKTGCAGVSGGVPRLGFPGFCLHDGPAGVRNVDGVNGFASGISIAAAFNTSLAYQRGMYMGGEFRKKGVNVALGPVVGPIGRVAEGGWNWEGFGADPYLNGVLGAQSVLGLQQSVIASVKHFIANEQETYRNPVKQNGKKSVSANVDDRTMHELYLWLFQDLFYAGAGCIMASYNRINQTYACENSKTINGLLKGELNFQGFVVSDWNGQHSGILSAKAGLDMAMPGSSFWDDSQLANAVKSKDLNETRLTDMATRIVATWYQFGQDSPSFPSLGIGMPADLLTPHEFVNAKDPAAKASLLEQAIEGHVLVKNMNQALPLKKPAQLSIFGNDAVVMTNFNPGPVEVQGLPVNLFQTNWEAISIQKDQLFQIVSNQRVTSPPETTWGTLVAGGASGSNTPAYISSPYDALQVQAYEDGTSIFYDFNSTDPNVAAESDACLVFINEFASETWDRPGLADPVSDKLVSNVASKCRNTIVVIHNAGIRLVDPWIDNPNVTAVILAHLPGQDAGRAIVQILYGVVSPCGRLPYTVTKSAKDYGDLLGPCGDPSSLSPQCDFKEGVDIDYRGFMARNVASRYEFGFGLTYTTFSYANLVVSMNATAIDGNCISGPVYENGTRDQSSLDPNIGVVGLKCLFENVGTIQATITNTGRVAAAEVAQLYLQTPNMTTRALRGFQKVFIEPAASAEVSFNLRRKDVSNWDTTKQAWVVPSGKSNVFVGKSVLDIQLTGSFET